MPPISWTQAHPELVEHEQAAMANVAPDMVWRDDLPSPREGHRLCGWVGQVPQWTADRDAPPGLDKLLGAARLQLCVAYPEAFPAIAPILWPLVPEVPLQNRSRHDWHVNGNGSLCLLRHGRDWHVDDTAADLVAKAAGWFVEYRLMEEGRIDAMSEFGIYSDASRDELIAEGA